MPEPGRPTDPVIDNIDRTTASAQAEEFGHSNRRHLYIGENISHFQLDHEDNVFVKKREEERQLAWLAFYGKPDAIAFRQLTTFGLAESSAESLGGYLETLPADFTLEQSATAALKATLAREREQYIADEVAKINAFIEEWTRTPWLIVDSMSMPAKRGNYPSNYATRHWLAPLVRVELNGENILRSVVRRNDGEEASVTGRAAIFTETSI